PPLLSVALTLLSLSDAQQSLREAVASACTGKGYGITLQTVLSPHVRHSSELLIPVVAFCPCASCPPSKCAQTDGQLPWKWSATMPHSGISLRAAVRKKKKIFLNYTSPVITHSLPLTDWTPDTACRRGCRLQMIGGS
uniref:Uncharacterized protein n=1 Tax=Fundulus heteroclitus TaxID=8078 RepID=A0A3Q2P7K0_FUNHE